MAHVLEVAAQGFAGDHKYLGPALFCNMSGKPDGH